MRPAHGEQHEFSRPLHRQQTQQDLIQQAEDRRVGADPERQRKDCHTRKYGGLGERT